MVKCQTSPQPFFHPALLKRTGEKIGYKKSWVKIKTGRSLNNYHQGQSRLDLGYSNLYIIVS